MAYLNTCTELDDLGKGKFRHIHHIKPIAYLENGVYKLSSANVAAYADGTYTHAVLAANIGVRIGDDGKYAIHPTRELARYAAFGGPQVKVGGKWTAVPFDKPVRKGNTVVWTREQADLKLTHIGHGLKHEMALKGGYVPEDNLIAVAVNLVGLTRSGSTLLADGVPVARIQAPVVYDAANTLDRRPIKWGITSRDGQPYIVYTLPDLAGMAAPVVDPTLTLQPDAAAGKDAYMALARPTANNGAHTSPGIGWFGAGDTSRSLYQFDLSSIPATGTVISAVLTLTRRGNFGTHAYTYGAYKLLRDWVEGTGVETVPADGVTWNTYDGANAWGTAGCDNTTTDREAVAENAHAVDYAANNTWAIPLMAQDWVTSPAGNYGFMVATTSAWVAQGVIEHYSSDSATASYRPKLVVEYTLPSAGGGMLLLGVG